MKKYPALTFVSGVYRFCGILAGASYILICVVSGDTALMVFGSILGVVVGASLYAMGELIQLLIQMRKDAYTSSLALTWMYQQQKARQESPKKRAVKISERKRA